MTTHLVHAKERVVRLRECYCLARFEVASEQLHRLTISLSSVGHAQPTMMAPIMFTKNRNMTMLSSPVKLPNTVV